MRKKLLRSRSGFEKPESREEAIMQNILGASNVLEPAESNIEEILQAILYNTPYTKEAEFEIEKILLAIKNNGTYDGEGESRDMKILIAILNDLDYTEEAESRIEELFIEWLHQRSSIKVLEGIPPLTFTSLGLPLINYLIEGNTVQSGAPSPDSPVMPEGCGDLETSGTKAGQYKIPISSANTTTPVYLGQVSTVRRIKCVDLGTLTYTKTGSGNFKATLGDGKIVGNREIAPAICSHFKVVSANEYATTPHSLCAAINSQSDVSINKTGFEEMTVGEFKSAMSGVLLWYALQTEQTGIVNEPLMRIGDYADTLSKEQAGVEIPTASGSNTLDVDTTVKPSNIYIEYK